MFTIKNAEALLLRSQLIRFRDAPRLGCPLWRTASYDDVFLLNEKSSVRAYGLHALLVSRYMTLQDMASPYAVIPGAPKFKLPDGFEASAKNALLYVAYHRDSFTVALTDHLGDTTEALMLLAFERNMHAMVTSDKLALLYYKLSQSRQTLYIDESLDSDIRRLQPSDERIRGFIERNPAMIMAGVGGMAVDLLRAQ